jgi:hypothetical protein
MHASMYVCYPIQQHHQLDGRFPLKTVRRKKVMARSPARPSRTCIRRARRVEFGVDPVRVGIQRSTYAVPAQLARTGLHGHGTYVISFSAGPARRARKRHLSCTLRQVDLHGCVSRTSVHVHVLMYSTEVGDRRRTQELKTQMHGKKVRQESQTGETVQAMHGSFSFVSFPSVSVAWWVRP